MSDKKTFSGRNIEVAVKKAAKAMGVEPGAVAYDVMAGETGGFALIRLRAGGGSKAPAQAESLSGGMVGKDGVLAVDASAEAAPAQEARSTERSDDRPPRRDDGDGDRGGRGRGGDRGGDRGGRGGDRGGDRGGRGRRDDRGGRGGRNSGGGGGGRRRGRERTYELLSVPNDGPTDVVMTLGEGIELSEIGEDAHEVLRDILTGMGFGCEVLVTEDERSIRFDIQTEPYREAFENNHLDLVEAMQHLLDKIVNFDADDRKPVTVDVNGFKAKADVDLMASAQELAEKAMAEGKVVKIGPLDPRSRRVVHVALTDVKGVSTRSEGEGAFRRVCIIPKKTPAPVEDEE